MKHLQHNKPKKEFHPSSKDHSVASSTSTPPALSSNRTWQKNRKFYYALGAAGFVLLAILSTLLWAVISLNTPLNSKDSSKVTFSVSEGQSLETISSNLKSSGLITNKGLFVIYSKIGPPKGKLIPGKYVFSPSLTIASIAESLAGGKTATRRVVFQEGLTIREIANKWARNGLGSAQNLQDASKLENTYKQSFLQYRSNNQSLEGYLFPATYDIPISSTPEDQINTMLDTFSRTVLPKLTQEVANSPKLNELITLASVVEKEAKTTEDRKLVAGVFYNRLAKDMPLDSDATINYVTGRTRTEAQDLKINSVYNSYLYKGLPPTPICNPGLDSILATLNPAPSDYLFFIADNTGKVHFAQNYEEHVKNIEKYLK